MRNDKVGWTFDVIKSLEPLKATRRSLIFFYCLAMTSFSLSVSKYLLNAKFQAIPIIFAIPSAIFASGFLIWFIKFSRRANIVRITELGLGYWSKEIIPWAQMTNVDFGLEDGQPYLVIHGVFRRNRSLHVPLYLNDVDTFREKLFRFLPSDHPIRKFEKDIEKATSQYSKGSPG